MDMTFLIVEDDRKTAKILKDNLQAAGIDIILAEDSYDAQRILLDTHVDRILTDVNLPYRDGFRFARALKQDKATSAIPVWLYSSREMDDPDRELARRYGIDKCLSQTKPLDIADFVKASIG